MSACNPAPGQGTFVSFDELSERPLDGVSLNGVSFAFDGTGHDIPVALFGSSLLSYGETRLMSAPWAVGPTAGTMWLTFSPPVSQVAFDVGLTETTPFQRGFSVSIFQDSQLLDSVGVPTSPGGEGPFAFSEAAFGYISSRAITSVQVTFDSAHASNFAFDNLRFVPIPEPSTFAVVVAALILLTGWFGPFGRKTSAWRTRGWLA